MKIMKSLVVFNLMLLTVIGSLISSCELIEANYIEPVPYANEATDITPTSFMASWTEVVGSTVYVLDVSSTADFGSFVEGYQSREVEGFSTLVTNLEIGKTYYYRVSVKKDNTISAPSNVVAMTTNILDNPIALDATDIISDSFTANWESVAGATNYTLQVSEFEDFSAKVSSFESTDTSLVVPDLNIKTNYFYKVRASNGTSTSSFSNTISLTTGEMPKPTILEAEAIFPHKFNANWAPSAQATSYMLEVARDPEFTQILPDYNGITVNDTTQEVRLFSVRIGQTHYYRIKALNDNSTSEYSDITEVGNGVPEGCRLERVMQTGPGDGLEYLYDDDGEIHRVIRYDNNAVERGIDLEYNEEGRVIFGQVLKEDLESFGESYTFAYDGEVISSITIRNNSANVTSYIEYEYDYNLRVTEERTYNDNDLSTANLNDVASYVYEEGDWSPIEEYNVDGELNVEWVYDDPDHPSPSVLMPNDLAFFTVRVTNITSNYNNRLFMEATGFVFQNFEGENEGYAYRYNSSGYATERIGDNARTYTYSTACGFD